MPTPKSNNKTDTFFQVVNEGSVADLKQLVKKIKHQEKAKIANGLNSEGETPLLVAIKRNNLKMVEFLVEKVNADISKTGTFKWKGVDYMEALPLFVAILTDFAYACQCISNFLVVQNTTYKSVTAIYDPIMPDVIPYTQKIDMLDLMGAAYMLNPRSGRQRIKLATHFWSLALEFRDELFTKFSDSSFLKTPSKSSECALNVFGDTTEFKTKNELEEILFENNQIDLDIQALLVIQRVLNRIDPDPHPFFLRRLLQFGEDWFSESSQYNRMVDVFLLFLEPFRARQWEDVVNYDWGYKFVLEAFKSISYAFWMKKTPPPNSSQFPFDSFLVILNYVSALVMKLHEPKNAGQLEKALIFIVFISDTIRMFTEQDKHESQEFKQWLQSFIQYTNSNSGVFTVLHATCYCPFLSVKTIQLLIDGGADPNALDDKGNAPLHCLAGNKDLPNAVAAVNLLLSVGARLDQPNKIDVTPWLIFKTRKMSIVKKN